MGEIRKMISENIKTICSLKGIRQAEIAEKLNVSPGTVSNWFKGTNSIDIENLAELCKFLGVSLDQIYGVAPLTPAVTLSQDETNLLGYFRALNEEGRAMLLKTAEAYAGSPSMQKEDGNSATA